MKAQEIDRQLAQIPPAAGPPVSEPSAAIAPLYDLMAEAVARADRSEPDPRDPVRERAQRAAMVRARLPEIFTSCTPQELIGRVRDRRLVSAARAARWFGPGFILLGKTELGKSSAAAWMFRRLLGEGLHAGGELWYAAERLRWFKASALMRARAEHPLGRGDAPEMVEAMTASLLFIDDAGWDRDDPSAVSHVLAERYDNGLPTVVTSGLTLAQLIEHYGDATNRRLVEAGGKCSVLVDCFEPA